MGPGLTEEALDRFLYEDLAALVRREGALFDELAQPWKDSIVVYGAGRLGRKVVAGLRSVGIEPLGWADKNAALWNTPIDGLELLSPADAARRFGRSAAFVVAVWSPGADRRIQTITQELSALGCSRVVSFAPLFWKFPAAFLPHYRVDLPRKVYARADRVKAGFRLMAGEESRSEFLRQLTWSVSIHFGELTPSTSEEPYFPGDLFELGSDEVFVDCGAFDGDTIRGFLARRKRAFERIVALEPDPSNLRRLRRYIGGLDPAIHARVSVVPAAIGAHRGTVSFDATGTISSCISDTGTVEVECVTLADALGSWRPTYVKMDIEGAEADALAGGRAVIEQAAPALAVCVYHRQEDLWEIPLLMASMCGEHRFFLRRYGDEFGDVVCYAVPGRRLLSPATEEHEAAEGC